MWTDVRPRVCAAFLIAALAGCGPYIDPAAKADIDRRVALLGPSLQGVSAPRVFQPRPFAVGQWTQHWVVRQGQPSFITTKIVGTKGDAFWVESVEETYFGKTVTKVLVFIGDRANPQSVEIRAGRIRDRTGRVTEMGPTLRSLMRSLFATPLGVLVVSWYGQSQEDIVVPAGAFAGCFRGEKIDAMWGPLRATSLAWSHPAVPISGLVRSQGIDRPVTAELVGYGDSGATSELP
ncbi:MAG TPA: hypothetical protein VH853_25525 [Polyangia bacterium]|jgi:hypothetical protein|nr:hypothetical protein [Polyangia bacterium]